MKRIKVQIDLQHSRKLLTGDVVAIKVPKDAQVIELRLAPIPDNYLAKCMDVFFNGRPA
jgi:hypothetical protein